MFWTGWGTELLHLFYISWDQHLDIVQVTSEMSWVVSGKFIINSIAHLKIAPNCEHLLLFWRNRIWNTLTLGSVKQRFFNHGRKSSFNKRVKMHNYMKYGHKVIITYLITIVCRVHMWISLPFSPKIHQGNSKQRRMWPSGLFYVAFIPLGDIADPPTWEFPLRQLFHFTPPFHLLQLGFLGRFWPKRREWQTIQLSLGF